MKIHTEDALGLQGMGERVRDLERQLAERDERIRVLREALERYATDQHLIMVGGRHSLDCRACQTQAALAEPTE